MNPGSFQGTAIQNLVILALASALAGLLWRFRLVPATTTAVVRETLPPFAVFTLFLLVNALWSASRGVPWQRAAAVAPLTSRAGLEAAANGAPVVVVGAVGKANTPVTGNYAFFFDGEAMAGPNDLLLDLTDGSAAARHALDAARLNWEGGSLVRVMRYWLRIGDPVVVVGTARHGVWMAGPRKGERSVDLEAALIFRGSHDAFLAWAEAEADHPVPKALAWISLAAALACLGLPLASLARLAIAGRG